MPLLHPSVSNPGPTAYNTLSYASVGSTSVQGGAPNNLTTLKRAEDKLLSDILFPFLVKDRLNSISKNEIET